MDLIIGIGIGIVFSFLASLILYDETEPAPKRVPSQRADELPTLPKTEDLQTYQDNLCTKCPHFDGYDMCLRREHWGSLIQNTVEYCKLRKNAEIREEQRSRFEVAKHTN